MCLEIGDHENDASRKLGVSRDFGNQMHCSCSNILASRTACELQSISFAMPRLLI